jgi:hypothetical protein
MRTEANHSSPDDQSEPLNEPEIRAALDRILASAQLRAAPQLTAFLRFVVDRALAHDEAHIKGYTIATEALGRDASFDPANDPIVRVEAGRLRRALDRYYAEAGADDPVHIELPRGSYAPVFRRREPDAEARATLPRGGFWRPKSTLRACTIVGAFFLLGAVVHAAFDYLLWDRVFGAKPALISRHDARPVQSGRNRLNARSLLPVVAVDAFEIVGPPALPDAALVRLDDRLRDALALFDEIEVLAKAPGLADSGPPTLSRDDAAALESDYRIGATIEFHRDGSASLTFRLLDTEEHSLIWSRMFDHVSLMENSAATRSKIIREVVTNVALVNGVIFAHERVKRATSGSIDPRYACLLDAIDYSHRYSKVTHQSVRTCLEDLVAADPSFALGYAYLAKIQSREHYFDTGAGGDAPAADRALKAAQRAVELKPGSARAYQSLMVALSIRHDLEPALAAGRMAMRLNPYSYFVQADLGLRLVVCGQIDEGLRMLREASANWMVRPVWVDIAMGLSLYLVDDLPAARMYIESTTSAAVPWALLVRAVIAERGGEPDQARDLAHRLIAMQPGWRDDPRTELRKVIIAPEIVDRMARDFEAIGLTSPN